MNQSNINLNSGEAPVIDFSITKSNGDLFDNYVLYSSPTANTPSSILYTFNNAYFITVGQIVKFTPDFSKVPANNAIIECKWTLGDGNKIFLTGSNLTSNSVYHRYPFTVASSTANGSYSNVSIRVKLTAIDKYQRAIRVHKIIYPKS